MCFETTKSARAKIAKTDIECWKVLTNQQRAPYYKHFRYKSGVICEKVKLNIFRTTRCIEIDEGYHSYKKQDALGVYRHSLYNGLQKGKMKWFAFIIPAGTRYFENETEYVSETIMML